MTNTVVVRGVDTRRSLLVVLLAVLLLGSVPGAPPARSRPAGIPSTPIAVVVQAVDGAVAAAAAAVEAVGGSVGRALPIVEGFAAEVPAERVDDLTATAGFLAVTPDQRVRFEELFYDATTTASSFAKVSGAPTAWSNGALGSGIGIAVLDTGISSMNDFGGRLVHGPDLSGEGTTIDSYGELAHAIGMRVVAEGVETAGQLSELRHIGCDVVQGWYIARPAGASEVEELMAPLSIV